MHVELVESLRCPHPHADGWLVASADEARDRRILTGTVGCPTCGNEWAITNGELRLSDAEAPSVIRNTTPDDAERYAALLNLHDARGAVLLTGSACVHADTLAAHTNVLALAVNAPRGVAEAHARVRTSLAIALGVATMRGAVLDAAHNGAAWLDAVVRSLEGGGRLVAPVGTPLPPGVQELARDDQEWVAEVSAASSGLVPLRRRSDAATAGLVLPDGPLRPRDSRPPT